MKVNNTQYAEALYEATKGKSQNEIDSSVTNFVKILEKNNQLKNVGNIINKFSEIWNKKEGVVEAEVITKEMIKKETSDKVEKFIKDKYKTEKVLIVNKIDKNIMGGIVIKVGDEMMDTSISGQLARLKNKLAN